MALKTPAKVLIGLIAIGGGYYGLKKSGFIDKHFGSSTTIDKSVTMLPTAPANAQTIGLTFAGTPSTTPSSKSSLKGNWKIQVPAWNAQMGLMYANGGPVTTEGSLMEKSGIKLTIERQDDDGVASTNLMKFAKDYQSNPSTATGVQMFTDMGDGLPALLSGVNAQLKQLDGGKGDYTAVIIGSVGRSNGEDALMAPAAWKTDPKQAIGSVISTVIRQGDWNIVAKWAADNAIPINPDEKTYDPTAINFVNAADFITAAKTYINQNDGNEETREVVQAGVDLHRKQKIKISGVASWTPADDDIAQGIGGLSRIVSTKDYPSQMTCAIVAIKKWAVDNKADVENFLDAAFQGGDQVKSFEPALHAGGAISAAVYKEKDADYWESFSKGKVETDKQSSNMEVGGSAQFNLADNLNYFGLTPGSLDIYTVIYNTYSKLDKTLYPTMFKSFDPAESVQDLDFLTDLKSKAPASSQTAAATQTYSSGAGLQTVSSKSYSIQFATGSAVLTPGGKEVVDGIAQSLIVANALKATIDGYTDNTGSDAVNQTLSQARAAAVKAEIQSVSPANFPESRFTVNGYGSDYSQLKAKNQNIGDNSTASGRQANRRVQVSMTKD